MPTGRKQLMNVLLIIIDDLRPELKSYGHPKAPATPNIDRLAATGRVFRRAYSQFPDCAPSRASFLTGLRPDVLGINTHHCSEWKPGSKHASDMPCLVREAAPNIITLPQAFRQAGYISLSYGKVFHQGLDDDLSWSSQEDFHDGYPRGQAMDQEWKQRAWRYEEWHDPKHARCKPREHGEASPAAWTMSTDVLQTNSVVSELIAGGKRKERPHRESSYFGNPDEPTNSSDNEPAMYWEKRDRNGKKSIVLNRRCLSFEHFASPKMREAAAELRRQREWWHQSQNSSSSSSSSSSVEALVASMDAAAAAAREDYRRYVDDELATRAVLSMHALAAGLQSTEGWRVVANARPTAATAAPPLRARRRMRLQRTDKYGHLSESDYAALRRYRRRTTESPPPRTTASEGPTPPFREKARKPSSSPPPPPRKGRPWFIAVGFIRPHLPFNCPEAFWNATRPHHEIPPQYFGHGASTALRYTQGDASSGFAELRSFVTPRSLQDFNNVATRFAVAADLAATSASSSSSSSSSSSTSSSYPSGTRATSPSQSIDVFTNATGGNVAHEVNLLDPTVETIFSLARDTKRGYRACVSFVDYQVGRLLDALEDSKQAHRTVVALISDHGYKLGEFGMWGKHSTLHTDLHVPFVMRHPRMTQRGRQSHVIVELIDLYPTLAELAGIWPKKEGQKQAAVCNSTEEATKPSDNTKRCIWPLSGKSRAALVLAGSGPTESEFACCNASADLGSKRSAQNVSGLARLYQLGTFGLLDMRKSKQRHIKKLERNEPVAVGQFLTNHGAHCMCYTMIFQNYSVIFWEKHHRAPRCHQAMLRHIDVHRIPYDETLWTLDSIKSLFRTKISNSHFPLTSPKRRLQVEEVQVSLNSRVPWNNLGTTGERRKDFIVRGIPFHLEATRNINHVKEDKIDEAKADLKHWIQNARKSNDNKEGNIDDVKKSVKQKKKKRIKKIILKKKRRKKETSRKK